MLKQLTLENIAIIDALSVSLAAGLTVITGETGAGKSILIESIGLALGAKAVAKDILKVGTARGRIELTVDLTQLPMKQALVALLSAHEIVLDPTETELLFSREITATSTRFRINGVAATRELVESLRPYVVDFHAQHEITDLLSKAAQRRSLDQLGGEPLSELKQKVAQAYGEWNRTAQELARLKSEHLAFQQRLDFVAFQLEELNQAQLGEADEDESLRSERERLMHSERLSQLSQKAVDGLLGGEWEESACVQDLLNKLQKPMGEAARIDASLEPLLEKFSEVQELVRHLADEWATYQQSLRAEPEALQQVVDRLDVLEKLKRKYGPHLQTVLETRDKLEAELTLHQDVDSHVDLLNDQLKALQETLEAACQALSGMRQQVAKDLIARLSAVLCDLALPHAQVDVSFQEIAPTAEGTEEVTFLFSANPGEPLRPLAKVASGGELSRILLSLKVIGAGVNDVPSMIFDEIDTGMSGVAAKSVGEKLCQLAHSGHQVLVITHQPIIAALGDCHLHVEKLSQGDERVDVSVENLAAKEKRLQVLSRLASGIDTDDEAVEKYIQRLLNEADTARIRPSAPRAMRSTPA